MIRNIFALSMLLASTLPSNAAEPETAILAGGCFWCVESDFDNVPGVVETISGYTGSAVKNPTYRTYSKTGHREVVQIRFDPDVISYEKILETFWRTVDPTDGGGQFCDRGVSYSPAIYVLDSKQEKIAQQSLKAAEKSLGEKFATPVISATKFWAAEDYHQNYAQVAPNRYNFYRWKCGRDKSVKALWGKQAYQGVKKH